MLDSVWKETFSVSLALPVVLASIAFSRAMLFSLVTYILFWGQYAIDNMCLTFRGVLIFSFVRDCVGWSLFVLAWTPFVLLCCWDVCVDCCEQDNSEISERGPCCLIRVLTIWSICQTFYSPFSIAWRSFLFSLCTYP